jgi:hypothetical protein
MANLVGPIMSTIDVGILEDPREGLKALATRCAAHRARVDPVEFAEFAFMDECGRPMRLGLVHRELQAFLSSAKRGLAGQRLPNRSLARETLLASIQFFSDITSFYSKNK